MTGYVDFFVHPVDRADEKILFDLEAMDLDAVCDDIVQRGIEAGVSHSVVHFFDQNVLYRPSQTGVLRNRAHDPALSFFCLMNPNGGDIARDIDAALEAGMRGVCFHPYLQKLTPDCYPGLASSARIASDAGLLVGVCASYGSAAIYRINPLECLLTAAEACSGPVIALHGGGAKIRDAILIADACANVYLETSFSLPYWLGSSVEFDFAYALRKFGRAKVLFGSDAPFCDLRNAIMDHLGFFERQDLDNGQVESVMGANALRLLKGLTT